MTLAKLPTRRNEHANNLAEAKPPEPPPVCVTREVWAFSFLLRLLEAQRTRIKLLEEFDRQKAVELDRLRRTERRVAA